VHYIIYLWSLGFKYIYIYTGTKNCKLSSQHCRCYIPKVLVGCVFILIRFQELFDFHSYFFSNPLVIQQWVVQSPCV
jgi:hypothetical protein